MPEIPTLEQKIAEQKIRDDLVCLYKKFNYQTEALSSMLDNDKEINHLLELIDVEMLNQRDIIFQIDVMHFLLCGYLDPVSVPILENNQKLLRLVKAVAAKIQENDRLRVMFDVCKETITLSIAVAGKIQEKDRLRVLFDVCKEKKNP